MPGMTPAVEMLRSLGIRFRVHEFSSTSGDDGYGLAAAAAIGVEPSRVFKTLVAQVDDDPVVAVVPVTCQLSLRALAVEQGGKRAQMCQPAAAQRITGYVVGGISPFGQKRRLPAVVDETVVLFDTVFVSGGRRGLDLELAPDDLVRVLGARLAPIAVDR